MLALLFVTTSRKRARSSDVVIVWTHNVGKEKDLFERKKGVPSGRIKHYHNLLSLGQSWQKWDWDFAVFLENFMEFKFKNVIFYGLEINSRFVLRKKMLFLLLLQGSRHDVRHGDSSLSTSTHGWMNIWYVETSFLSLNWIYFSNLWVHVKSIERVVLKGENSHWFFAGRLLCASKGERFRLTKLCLWASGCECVNRLQVFMFARVGCALRVWNCATFPLPRGWRWNSANVNGNISEHFPFENVRRRRANKSAPAAENRKPFAFSDRHQ